MKNLSINSDESNPSNPKDIDSLPQKKLEIRMDGREYLKKLGSQINFSRAGQSFVMSFPKPSANTTSSSMSSDNKQKAENSDELSPEK